MKNPGPLLGSSFRGNFKFESHFLKINIVTEFPYIYLVKFYTFSLVNVLLKCTQVTENENCDSSIPLKTFISDCVCARVYRQINVLTKEFCQKSLFCLSFISFLGTANNGSTTLTIQTCVKGTASSSCLSSSKLSMVYTKRGKIVETRSK